MPLPTPAEQTANYPLPKGWQSLPTTDSSEAVTIAIVQEKYGATVGGYFKNWYDKARAKDPGITPNQAATAFIAGYTIAKGTGKLASFLTGSPAVITSGSGADTVNLGSVSEGPGVAQAAASAAESLYNTSPGGSSSACAVHIPGISAGVISWGGWCVISKTNLRSLVGGSLLLAGGLTGIVATVLAIGFAFSETKAGRTAVQASGKIGGYGRAVSAVVR